MLLLRAYTKYHFLCIISGWAHQEFFLSVPCGGGGEHQTVSSADSTDEEIWEAVTFLRQRPFFQCSPKKRRQRRMTPAFEESEGAPSVKCNSGQKVFSRLSSTALAVGQERRPNYADLSLLTCSCCACLSRVSIICLVPYVLNVKDRFLLTAAPKVLLGRRCQRKVDWLR